MAALLTLEGGPHDGETLSLSHYPEKLRFVGNALGDYVRVGHTEKYEWAPDTPEQIRRDYGEPT